MPVSIRNTDILFNDSSTQTRSAHPAFTAGSNLFGVASNSSVSTSYSVSAAGVVLAAGTIRARFQAQGQTISVNTAYGTETGTAVAEARIFINGVGVGSLITSPSGGNSAVSQQDFTVAAGDILQVGVRRVSNSGSFQPVATILAQFGCGAVLQTDSFRTGGGAGSTFTI